MSTNYSKTPHSGADNVNMIRQSDNSPQEHTALKKTLVVGLTGGIGSGKSAASDWFAQQGINIIDADVIAHVVVAKGS